MAVSQKKVCLVSSQTDFSLFHSCLLNTFHSECFIILKVPVVTGRVSKVAAKTKVATASAVNAVKSESRAASRLSPVKVVKLPSQTAHPISQAVGSSVPVSCSCGER